MSETSRRAGWIDERARARAGAEAELPSPAVFRRLP